MTKEMMLNVLRTGRSSFYRIMFSGNNRYCAVCNHHFRKFLRGGRVDKRDDARCPSCGSHERYRFAWLYFVNHSDVFTGNKKVLHVAPEKCYGTTIQEKVGPGYLSVDLSSPLAMEKMDIMSIGYSDCCFDIIYCNHVLEHVDDDIRAMREFYRVLKDDGWALIQVPINTDVTFEDSSITDPQHRLKVFGQTDHVRNYGSDFVDRLRSVGFKVSIISPGDLYSNKDISRMGIEKEYAGDLFVCTKT